ncbi:MAG: PA2169 family four-helix-bundle protein [Tardiphaga sp.]|nr:PA2169 family four-helix-bundle protein [Tardiphaga sp.]
MTSNEHDIDVLNNLIETVIDSADGYQQAIKETEASRFSDIFARRGAERQLLTEQMQAQVRALGGSPEDDGTLLASAHRMFLNLRHAVAGGDQAVIDEVESGEDHIKAKFEDAMQDIELTAPTRTLIEDGYKVVKDGHDEIRDLKHAMHGGER